MAIRCCRSRSTASTRPLRQPSGSGAGSRNRSQRALTIVIGRFAAPCAAPPACFASSVLVHRWTVSHASSAARSVWSRVTATRGTGSITRACSGSRRRTTRSRSAESKKRPSARLPAKHDPVVQAPLFGRHRAQTVGPPGVGPDAPTVAAADPNPSARVHRESSATLHDELSA
jgi:hypothetical protein